MQIIDTHAHIFPPKIEKVATDAIGNFYENPMRHSGSPEALLAAGERAGLTGYVVFSTATTPMQVTKINDFIIEQCAIHPGFFGAGTMHRDFSDYEAEIDRIYAAGLRGIKFHPDFQRFNIDSDEMLPIFGCIENRSMFIITHAGDCRYPYSHPERIRRIAEMFPKMNIVAAHFGGWSLWELGRKTLADLPNVYYDTSSTFGFAGVEPMKEAFRVFDTSHIFFGCDFPMWDHEDELRVILSLGLDSGLTEDVLGGNFLKFYSQYKP